MQTQKIALSSEDKTPSPKMTEILVNETESHELNKKDKQSEIIGTFSYLLVRYGWILKTIKT